MSKEPQELASLLVEKCGWKYGCQGCEYEGKGYSIDDHEPDDITTPDGIRSFYINSLVCPQGPMSLVWDELKERGLLQNFVAELFDHDEHDQFDIYTINAQILFNVFEDLTGQVQAAIKVLREPQGKQ